MFISIKWKVILFLSVVTFAILASVLFYNINKVHQSYEQDRLQRVQFNNRLFQKLLHDKSLFLSQTTELIENLLKQDNLNIFTLDIPAPIENIWENLNEQFDILFFEVSLSTTHSIFKGNEIFEFSEQSAFLETRNAAIQNSLSSGERQSFIYCFDECVFFNVEPIPFGENFHFLIIGKSLADTFILFSQAIHEEVGILKSLDGTEENAHIDGNRIISNWNKYVMAVTNFGQVLPLLKMLGQKFPNIEQIDKQLVSFNERYLTLSILETGLPANISNQQDKKGTDFIILDDETANYIQLNNNVRSILLAGAVIWIISQLIMWYFMGRMVDRLKNLSHSLSLLTHQKFNQAKQAIRLGNKKKPRDELDHLESSDIQLADTLELLHDENQSYKRNLEKMVVERTASLNEAKQQIETLHKSTQDSIEHASIIQSTLIPDDLVFKRFFRDFFTIWQPKDVVGGDIYLTEELSKDEIIIMVIDCTGHGVPGAFVTMLVKAVEQQILKNLNSSPSVSPAFILGGFNRNLKKLLNQEHSESVSNVGFDGAIIYYNKKNNIIRFSGANLPLYIIRDEALTIIKGDRHSIGYKKSDSSYIFTDHEIEIDTLTQLYLSTDGFIDQTGGKRGFSFGKKRFAQLIEKHAKIDYSKQQLAYLAELKNYQGEHHRKDDITVVGFAI